MWERSTTRTRAEYGYQWLREKEFSALIRKIQRFSPPSGSVCVQNGVVGQVFEIKMNIVNSGKTHSGVVGTESLVSRDSGSLVGRELDAAIAERVMGWKHGDRDTFCDRPFVSCPVCLARFSTDIAAAMEVWDKLMADGYLPRLLTMVDGYVVNLHRSDRFHVVQAEANTREVAICRAALQAVALNVPTK